MKQLFLNLDDAIKVAVNHFNADPEIARIEFEQKCYISSNEYSIGYDDGIDAVEKKIEELKKEIWKKVLSDRHDRSG